MSSKISPKCLNPNAWAPLSVRADGLLKPCNFFAIFQNTEQLIQWASDHGADAVSDLDIRQNTFEQVYTSRTWQLIQEGFTNGDPCPVCRDECGVKDK